MTVETQVKKVTGDGNDSATVFSFSPMVLPDASTDMEVYLVDADDVETLLVEGTGDSKYSVTVTSYPGTGSITYPEDAVTPIATGVSVLMKRVLTLEQLTDLENQATYFADTQEQQLDKLVMIDLQQQEELDRSFRFPLSYTGGITVTTDVPAADDVLKINSAGTGMVWATVLSLGEVAASDSVAQGVSLSAGSAGTGADYSRDDHVHLLPTVSIALGGTGAVTASAARTALGLAIGSDIPGFNADGGITLTDTDDGAGEGPILHLYRNSASPTASDLIGIVKYEGEDDAGNLTIYSQLSTKILSAANGSETAEVRLHVIKDDSLVLVANFAEGVEIGSPTGGDKGAGTLNVENGIFVDGSGTMVQTVNTQTGAVATGTTTFPVDDTIPQNDEGDEYMTLAITPKNTNNKLKIEVVFFYAHSVSGSLMSIALFQDATANALAAGLAQTTTSNHRQQFVFTHYMTAGTISETTFKVRAGPVSSGTLTFNGQAAARFFGGVMASSITITEIAV